MLYILIMPFHNLNIVAQASTQLISLLISREMAANYVCNLCRQTVPPEHQRPMDLKCCTNHFHCSKQVQLCHLCLLDLWEKFVQTGLANDIHPIVQQATSPSKWDKFQVWCYHFIVCNHLVASHQATTSHANSVPNQSNQGNQWLKFSHQAGRSNVNIWTATYKQRLRAMTWTVKTGHKLKIAHRNSQNRQCTHPSESNWRREKLLALYRTCHLLLPTTHWQAFQPQHKRKTANCIHYILSRSFPSPNTPIKSTET